MREFIEDDLGPEGLSRSVVVIATSDTPPLMRREAAYTATAIAEHFRRPGVVRAPADGQRDAVLPGVARNSLFRPASHQRRVAIRQACLPNCPACSSGRGLALCWSHPRMAPPRAGQITALFTVLVEGDDHDEPVADAVSRHPGWACGAGQKNRRSRALSCGGRIAVPVAGSVGCLNPAQSALVRRARAILSLWADMADMVRLGAYKAGSDPAIDEAVRLAPRIEAVLAQGRLELTNLADSFAMLTKAVEGG